MMTMMLMMILVAMMRKMSTEGHPDDDDDADDDDDDADAREGGLAPILDRKRGGGRGKWRREREGKLNFDTLRSLSRECWAMHRRDRAVHLHLYLRGALRGRAVNLHLT